MQILLIISILTTLEMLFLKAILLSKLTPEEIIPKKDDYRRLK